MAHVMKLKDNSGYISLSYQYRPDGVGITIKHIDNYRVDIHKEQILQIAAEILGVSDARQDT